MLSRYPGSVIRFRQLSRSSIRPCEQVGEHHDGAGGCLASGDSGGIRAGATDGGGKLGAAFAVLDYVSVPHAFFGNSIELLTTC